MGPNFALSSSILLLIIFIASVDAAHAYIDPGTGSAILQGILGALAAIAIVAKLYWYRILRFFGLSKSRSELEKKVEGGDKG
jgi:hypothetical protein